MNTIFSTGVIGSLILVTGAAWPELKTTDQPTKSVKNWLLAIGGLAMFIYALLSYLAGGSVFFVFLQTLILIASAMMMLNTKDITVISVISICTIGLIVWSLTLFNGINTMFFIIGLAGIALGYALKPLTKRRMMALILGSLLIAIFSYVEKEFIFFWLNVFFTIFSGGYLIKRLTINTHQ